MPSSDAYQSEISINKEGTKTVTTEQNDEKKKFDDDILTRTTSFCTNDNHSQ